MVAHFPTPKAPWPVTHSVLDAIGNTALVPLRRIGAGLPVPLYAKCEHLNPGGSVKDRLAWALVSALEAEGTLTAGDMLVEATAGNTGVGLAMVAAVRGYRLTCVMPEKMSVDKRQALSILGARVVVTPNAPPHDPRNFQNVARQLATQPRHVLCNQFAAPANPAVHETMTGPEILQQLGQVPGAFVAGAGTGGTLTGVGRCFRACAPGARVVLADPVGSRLAHHADATQPDLDAAYAVEGIGQSSVPPNLDLTVVDDVVRVTDEESFAACTRLLREEGMLVGGSSGTALAAALKLVATRPPAGPVVVLLADAWDRYWSKPWMRGLATPEEHFS